MNWAAVPLKVCAFVENRFKICSVCGCALGSPPRPLQKVTNGFPRIYQFAGLMCFSQDTCALDRLQPKQLSPLLNADLLCRQRRPCSQVASGGHAACGSDSRLCFVTVVWRSTSWLRMGSPASCSQMSVRAPSASGPTPSSTTPSSERCCMATTIGPST